VDQLLNVDNLGRLLDARQADFGQVNGNLAPVDHNCEPVVTRVGFDDLVQLAAVVVQVVGVFLLVSLAVPESEDESVAPAFQLLGLVDDEGAAAGFVAVVFVFLEVGGDLLLLGLPGFVFVVYVLVHVWGNRDAVEFEDWAGGVVATVDEERVREDFFVGSHLDAEGVHEHVFECKNLGWFEELALQHAGVVLLLFDDLVFVFSEPVDDAEDSLAALFLGWLVDLFV
jgi:hypothetical protein